MKLLSRFLFFHKNGTGRHAGVKGSGASRPDQKVDLLGQLLSQNRVFSIFRKEPPSPLEEVANLAKHINLFFSLSVIYQGILVTSSTTRIFIVISSTTMILGYILQQCFYFALKDPLFFNEIPVSSINCYPLKIFLFLHH